MRSDQAIEPTPTSDSVTVTAVSLHAVYEEFLRQLVTYVIVANLSVEDQKTVGGLRLHVDALRQQNSAWEIADYQAWKSYGAATGKSVDRKSVV